MENETQMIYEHVNNCIAIMNAHLEKKTGQQGVQQHAISVHECKALYRDDNRGG